MIIPCADLVPNSELNVNSFVATPAKMPSGGNLCARMTALSAFNQVAPISTSTACPGGQSLMSLFHVRIDIDALTTPMSGGGC